MRWTLFFNGGIFEYFLPNLRFFRKITTFGNLEVPVYTHDITDIGGIAAKAVADERTLNKCVQVDFNALTQMEMLNLLKKYWPDYPFEYEYFPADDITRMKDTAGDEVTAKKGADTDRERWGINYTIYVVGALAACNEQTLRTTDLYPDCAAKNRRQPFVTPRLFLKRSER